MLGWLDALAWTLDQAALAGSCPCPNPDDRAYRKLPGPCFLRPCCTSYAGTDVTAVPAQHKRLRRPARHARNLVCLAGCEMEMRDSHWRSQWESRMARAQQPTSLVPAQNPAALRRVPRRPALSSRPPRWKCRNQRRWSLPPRRPAEEHCRGYVRSDSWARALGCECASSGLGGPQSCPTCAMQGWALSCHAAPPCSWFAPPLAAAEGCLEFQAAPADGKKGPVATSGLSAHRLPCSLPH